MAGSLDSDLDLAMVGDDQRDPEPLPSGRPRRIPRPKRAYAQMSRRLFARAVRAAQAQGFSSLNVWLRTAVWQLVSEVEEEVVEQGCQGHGKD